MSREERRWRLGQPSHFFISVFSRKIYCIIWWWWLFVVYLVSEIYNSSHNYPDARVYFFGGIVSIITVGTLLMLSRPDWRMSWLAVQQTEAVSPLLKCGIIVIPILGCVVVAIRIALW